MAIREIRVVGDDCLKKVCKPVDKLTLRQRILIEDMLDTMYEANGVGLAAPQVGVCRRIAVIDVGEGPIVLINPVIISMDGEQTGDEGCLSLPGKAAQVTRANHVVVEYYDEEMQKCVVEGEELFARALQHEIEHLDGHMYTEKAEGPIHDVHYEEDDEEEA